VAQGEMKLRVGNLSISAAVGRPADPRRDVNPVSARVMTAVNSIYFPEKTNNVRGDDLFKCTDLVIDRTPSSGDFDEAEIWARFSRRRLPPEPAFRQTLVLHLSLFETGWADARRLHLLPG